MQNVHDKVYRESGLARVSGHRVHNTTHGKIIVPSRKSGNGGGVPEMYVLAEPTEARPLVVRDDYLIVRDWDEALYQQQLAEETYGDEGEPSPIGETDVLVAKQFKHRCSLTGETVLGVEYTYTYEDDTEDLTDPPEFRQNKIRVVEDEFSNVEEWRIVPPWVPSRTDEISNLLVPGDIIFAIECDNTGVTVDGEELTLLYCCEARQWAHIIEDLE